MCLRICFFFKQKTAYELRISDWSSDVCSSDLLAPALRGGRSGNLSSRQECLSGAHITRGRIAFVWRSGPLVSPWIIRGLLAAQLAVLGQVEDFARAVVVLQQAQPAGDFLIGFFLTAQIAAEAVLEIGRAHV